MEKAKVLSIEKNSATNPYLFLLKENDISKNPLKIREIDVLKHLVKGASNKLISEELFTSIHTVKSHIRNIYIKTSINK